MRLSKRAGLASVMGRSITGRAEMAANVLAAPDEAATAGPRPQDHRVLEPQPRRRAPAVGDAPRPLRAGAAILADPRSVPRGGPRRTRLHRYGRVVDCDGCQRRFSSACGSTEIDARTQGIGYAPHGASCRNQTTNRRMPPFGSCPIRVHPDGLLLMPMGNARPWRSLRARPPPASPDRRRTPCVD